MITTAFYFSDTPDCGIVVARIAIGGGSSVAVETVVVVIMIGVVDDSSFFHQTVFHTIMKTTAIIPITAIQQIHFVDFF
jgi:hypothetical protein